MMRSPRHAVPIAVITGFLASAAPSSETTEPFADNACVQCHRDLPGRSSAIVELEWKPSVHYAAGVSCDACHGGNAAVRRDAFESDEAWKRAAHLQRDPEFLFMRRADDTFVSAARGRSVSYFCGKCHANIKEKHLGSPHGEFGDPTCLYCHGQGSHRILKPTVDTIDVRGRVEGGRCSPCHLASTMETVAQIKESLERTEARIGTAAGLSDELEALGYRNLELQQLHDDAQVVRSKLRQVFHSFNMGEINDFVTEIELTVDRTVATHEMIVGLRQAQRRQALIGALAVLLLLTFAGLLVYYRHAFLGPDPDRSGG